MPTAFKPASTAALETSAPAQAQVTPSHLTNDDRAILDYLKGSFAALHRSAATITGENAVAPVLPDRVCTARQNTRVQFAVDAVAHSYDHYGQMAEYLRMNGIVPPASRK